MLFFSLYREALKQSITDPRSGCVDVSILATGRSHAQREESKIIGEALRNIIGKRELKGQTVNYKDLFQDLKEVMGKVSSDWFFSIF